VIFSFANVVRPKRAHQYLNAFYREKQDFLSGVLNYFVMPAIINYSLAKKRADALASAPSEEKKR